MLTRRDFFQTAALTLPLAGCTREAQPQPAPIGKLSPQQMEEVRKEAKQFEQIADVVRKADVPYAIEPRFYPTV
jgi:hypothetical protein